MSGLLYPHHAGGMPAGSQRHVLCTLDLQAIRANVERRIGRDDF